jgi:hypothetical protein
VTGLPSVRLNEEDGMNIHDYIVSKSGLRKDVEKLVMEYESYTFIDAFMRRSEPKWFYEGTVQGFIYYSLFFKYHKEVLFFLEEPYSSTDMNNRSDIMFVLPSNEEISAIEIKDDFSYDSIRIDLEVLVKNIHDQNIKYGYGIFFAQDENTIKQWNTNLKKDKNLKDYINETIFPVGMVGVPK